MQKRSPSVGLQPLGNILAPMVLSIGLRSIGTNLRQALEALDKSGDYTLLGKHLESAMGIYNRLVAEKAIPSNPAPESEREVA